MGVNKFWKLSKYEIFMVFIPQTDITTEFLSVALAGHVLYYSNLMLITEISSEIPQSDVITGSMKHAAFLPFSHSLKFFELSKHALYPHSMLKAPLTDWSLCHL